MCEEDEELAPRMHILLRKAKLQVAKIKERVISICFCEDSRYPPLQAADLLGHVVFQEMKKRMGLRSNGAAELFPVLIPESNAQVQFISGTTQDRLAAASR